MKDKDYMSIIDEIDYLMKGLGVADNNSKNLNARLEKILNSSATGRPQVPDLNADVPGMFSGSSATSQANPYANVDTRQGSAPQAQEEAKPEEPEQTLDELLAELDSLVGLEKVKEDIHTLLNFIKICKLREERGMEVPTISYHLVFTGNPGTGKTTVARLVAKIYKAMGLLPKGQLIETDRSGLVAGYVGQTAIKTQEVIKSALGGVLFIDEAYSLANDDRDVFGKEAIETILKNMEDHRDELVVIVAGYDNLMYKFIESNPGLKSRFSKYVNFPDYDGDAMYQIFMRNCKKSDYETSEDFNKQLREYLDNLYENRTEHFGNARTVRNIFEHSINAQANRLAKSTEEVSDADLKTLTPDDLEVALALMAENQM